ncbi:MAG: hypothetical protein LBP93_04260 [Treponema sp.]|jgi:hypothetical protein|nr:hypothetical protein [Treponema sp.]
MGTVYAEITLKDAGGGRRGYITEQEVLRGVIPLEGPDLIVDPVQQVLTGPRGDEVPCMVNRTEP